MTDTSTPTTNWAGNVTFSARAVHRPTSLDEVRRLVTGAGRVRALGSRHSFSTVADSEGDLVVLDRMPRDVVVDATTSTVTVSGGCTYGDVVGPLHDAGLALPSMGSLPHISVAGAAATGTHGSGDENQVLAASVVAAQLVTATGDVLELDRDDVRFGGSLVALGTLGILTRVTLAAVPGYRLVQQVQDLVPVETLVTAVDEVLSAGYSVSAFTSWAPGSTAQVWVKRDPAAPAPVQGWLGGVAADGPRHPVPGMPTEHATQQLGVAGAWHERLPHFRMEFTPSSGDELQTEYLVPRRHAAAASAAVAGLGDRIAPVLQIGELRSVAGDGLWLSAAYGRDSLALHFTWVPDLEAVRPLLAEIEAALAPFDARPHWGKVFTTAPGVVRSLYPRLPDFVALRNELDPDRRFSNAFVDRYLGP